IADGHWLVPHVNGEVTTDKPPLFFWLIALFSLPFGSVSSLTARLPSLLAAVGSVALTIRLGRRMAGPRTAVVAGALLATTYMFWDKARSAQIDALLCFLILAAVSAFEAFRRGDADGRRAGLLFWTAAGLAVLAKGPVGLLLPLGIALVTLACDRELGRWRSFAPLAGPLAFVAVTGLWIAAVTLWAEDYSVWAALREHFVDRAVHGMHHRQPVWYYLKVLPYALLPWSFLLPGALVLAWRRRRRDEDRFLMVFALFVILFFTLPTEKRDLYILPALPAIALLMARLVAAVTGWQPAEGDSEPIGRRWVTVSQGGVAALLILAGAALPFIAPRFGSALLVPAYGLGAVLALGGVGILVAAARGQPLRSVERTIVAMAAAMLVAVSFVFPALNPVKSGRQLALAVRDATVASRAAGRPVLGLDLGNVPRAVNFYSGGIYLTEVSDPMEAVATLASGGATYLLADEEALPAFPAELQRRLTVVYSTRLSRKDLVLIRCDE
ncbi:MAG: glycosyltransferase family 39 protein, partial [bacterium]|nr:glycosyltransferase family 39 protein [bacterium]